MSHVRRADVADAAQMSAVLVASITQLCALDHKGNDAFLSRWLANKSVDQLVQMLNDPNMTLFVVERHCAIAAVGAIEGRDVIALNYVDPAHRFAGVSSLLLGTLEQEIAARGAGPR